MSKTKTPYTLSEACGNCPFRCDNPTYLREERAREIAQSLREGATFYCHQTVDYTEDEEGEATNVIGPRARACAGSLIVMEKEGFSNQMVRIGERLGLYDATRLNMDSPVHPSLTEWIRAHGSTPTSTDEDGEEVEFEHCGIVAQDCEDPAGFSGYGGAFANDEEPTCNPLTDSCQHCGSVMCPACTASVEGEGKAIYKTCAHCAEEE